MQLKAGYILQPIKSLLDSFKGQQSLKVTGLLNNLSVFDVFSKVDLSISDKPSPLFAVANNIITRGLPTIASPFVEQKFSIVLSLTHKNETKRGVLEYLHSDAISKEKIIQALHPIDSRYKDREKYINVSSVDSTFELSFLFDYIPKEEAHLAFMFDQQRARNSLGAESNNLGRVDFSLEIPYFITETRINRYRKETETRHQKKYIVEVDGAKYHNNTIDNLKDYEIAELPNNINHIRENTVYPDVQKLIQSVSKEPYVGLVKKNFNDDILNQRDYYTLILSPIGIARIQSVIIQYLLSKQFEKSASKTLKIAVVERDVSCGRLAIDDLTELLAKLNAIALADTEIPVFEFDIFSTPEFIDHSFNAENDVDLIKNCKSDKYDLVIDISLLSKFYSINHPDVIEGDNVITVRNCHYIELDVPQSIVSTLPITYKDVVIPKENEQFEDIDEVKLDLEYFIQLFFRKEEFRVGQLPILNRALKRQSVIGLLPTGGGKSLTYQLASLLQPGITIVIDPIRSLMIDQYDSLRKIGIDRAEFINSTISSAEKRYNQAMLTKGAFQFLFVSPERYVIKPFRDSLIETVKNGFNFSYAVIDEVHCVSEWGHDFRTDYLNLGRNIIEYTKTGVASDSVPLFGLTATASYDVLSDIERELKIADDDGNAIVRYENTIRDEVNYQIVKVDIEKENDPNHEYSAWDLRDRIGEEKQLNCVDWIKNLNTNIGVFNKNNVLEVILENSYDNYLPDSQKKVEKGNEEVVIDKDHLTKGQYVERQFNNLILHDEDFVNVPTNYKAASVVFCPHKNGAFGVKNVETTLFEKLQPIDIGTFMGSGDGSDSKLIDETSFANQKKFIANQQSVMVATKAFGMGIDKDNVRSTIHMNVPSSIESFVQESGRAGRDKKLSLCTIMFNDQLFKVGNDEHYWVEEEILTFFHKKSFKGKIKERQIIHELRSSISYPGETNLNLLLQESRDRFNAENLKLGLGRGDRSHLLYLNDFATEEYFGALNILDLRVFASRGLSDPNKIQLANNVLSFISKQLEAKDVNERSGWLSGSFVEIPSEKGLERRLAEMELGESHTSKVAFTNRFYSKPANKNDFVLCEAHLSDFYHQKEIQEIINENLLNITQVRNGLHNAVQQGLEFEEFVEDLTKHNSSLEPRLSTDDIRRSYFKTRAQDDTAKSIYRLTSIGIIDDYTIDYQNKCYYVKFSKKEDGQYFTNLQLLISRYTSQGNAAIVIDQLRLEYEGLKTQKKATEISLCLEFLTDFIYDKIADKRKQAIKDMLSMCKIATQEEDPVRQNEIIKDDIYYYFNAKYSRLNNVAIELIGDNRKDVPASFPVEKQNEASIISIIEKYIPLIENDITAGFKNNVKHLRGACMRTLREEPYHPAYKILKAYSLFILSDTTDGLLKDALTEMTEGFVLWQNQTKTENIFGNFDFIKMNVLKHVKTNNVKQKLEEVEGIIKIKYYARWTSNFTHKFTKDLKYD
jgi:ATP-dependent DNA helicase RecQ